MFAGATGLSLVVPPVRGYSKHPVRAQAGHTYAAQALVGEEGHYIVFRVLRIEAGEFVEIEFLYL